MYNIGIFNWYGYVEAFEKRVKEIKEAGYDHLMLWWEDETYPEFIDRREFIKIVKSYDLKLDNVHLPSDGINTLWFEGSDRIKKVDEIRRWMNECRESGAEMVVLHSTSGIGIALDKSMGYKSFEKIIGEAEDIKLKVAVENIRMLKYLDFVLEEFISDYAGLCYDSSHDFIEGQSCGGILERWKDRLFCLHLSDCDGISDKHWIPGKGIVDWRKIIGIIKETECKNISMEIYPDQSEKIPASHDFIKSARKNILELIQRGEIL